MGFRSKNALISFIFIFLCLVFLSISRISGFVLYGTILFMMLVYYFMIYWLFNFDVYPQGFISILLLPTLTLASYLLIYFNFIKELPIIYVVFFTLTFMVMQYYLVLTQNILNLSTFTNVGLSQAALVSNSFYTILGFFLLNLSIFLIPNLHSPFKIVIGVIIFVIFYFIFVIINKIEFVQFIFGVFFYGSVSIIYLVLFLIGYINPLNSLLIVISLAVIFRGLTVIALYSFRKVISVFDFIQIIFESALVAFLVYMSSI